MFSTERVSKHFFYKVSYELVNVKLGRSDECQTPMGANSISFAKYLLSHLYLSFLWLLAIPDIYGISRCRIIKL